MNRLQSLFWFRWQYLITNKVLLFVCVVTPFLDFLILQTIPFIHGEIFFLNIGLDLVYSLTAGSFTSLMVSEEKEKKMLRTLILTGVTRTEYILSTLAFPFFFSALTAISMPIFFGIHIQQFTIYCLVVMMTSLIFILINLLIGLFAKTQVHASLFSMLVLLIATFLPMIAIDNSNSFLFHITQYSFIGANTEFLTRPDSFNITSSSMIATIFWVICLIILTHYAFKWNGKDHS